MEWTLGSFGDLRLDKRGGAILERMIARKTVCLRRVGGHRAGEEGAQRVFSNRRVTKQAIIAGRSVRTGAACAHRHVLAIDDTCEVKFPTTVQRRRGLGPLAHRNVYDLLAHSMIAVDAESQRTSPMSPFRAASSIWQLFWTLGRARWSATRSADQWTPASPWPMTGARWGG